MNSQSASADSGQVKLILRFFFAIALVTAANHSIAQLSADALLDACKKKTTVFERIQGKLQPVGEKFDGLCHGYLVGSYDASIEAKTICALTDPPTPDYLFSVVETYLKSEPAVRERNAIRIVISAYTRAFPCKDQPPVSPSRTQSRADEDPPEILRLCKKWDGTVVAKRPSGPAYLRCSHIRTQFERTAKGASLFGPIRLMIESIRHQNLLHLKAADLPKDQKCTIERGETPRIACKTLDVEPQISMEYFGTESGVFMKAIISADLDWFRKEMTRQTQSQHGVPPTPAFLDYYLDLLVTVSSYLGDPREQYSLSGDKILLVINLR